MDDYYSEENLAKRDLQHKKLNDIEDQIKLLQKQYSQLSEEYSKENYYIRHKCIIYTLIDNDTLPYGWSNEGATHIGNIADSFEDENNRGWLSSTTRCEYENNRGWLSSTTRCE